VICEKYVQNKDEEAKNQVIRSAGYLNEQSKFYTDVYFKIILWVEW
jgi:hypothetical protein